MIPSLIDPIYFGLANSDFYHFQQFPWSRFRILLEKFSRNFEKLVFLVTFQSFANKIFKHGLAKSNCYLNFIPNCKPSECGVLIVVPAAIYFQFDISVWCRSSDALCSESFNFCSGYSLSQLSNKLYLKEIEAFQ